MKSLNWVAVSLCFLFTYIDITKLMTSETMITVRIILMGVWMMEHGVVDCLLLSSADRDLLFTLGAKLRSHEAPRARREVTSWSERRKNLRIAWLAPAHADKFSARSSVTALKFALHDAQSRFLQNHTIRWVTRGVWRHFSWQGAGRLSLSLAPLHIIPLFQSSSQIFLTCRELQLPAVHFFSSDTCWDAMTITWMVQTPVA